MVSHVVKDGTATCRACGAYWDGRHWWADRRVAPFSNVMVSEDCDIARSQIYGGRVDIPSKPVSTAPDLKPAELERLAFLMEECGEVIQAAGKILRHGYAASGYTNRADLEKEIGDVLAAVCLMAEKDIDMEHVNAFKHRKLASVRDHMHHQEDT